jgi:hypothetical protein
MLKIVNSPNRVCSRKQLPYPHQIFPCGPFCESVPHTKGHAKIAVFFRRLKQVVSSRLANQPQPAAFASQSK